MTAVGVSLHKAVSLAMECNPFKVDSDTATYLILSYVQTYSPRHSVLCRSELTSERLAQKLESTSYFRDRRNSVLYSNTPREHKFYIQK